MKTQDAIDFFGNKVKVATALGLHRSAITNWGEEVPPRRAHEIEKLTGGKLKSGIVIPGMKDLEQETEPA